MLDVNRPKKTGYGARITIRQATALDVGYIRSLGKEVFQQYGPYEDLLPEWFASGLAVTLLASIEERTAGFAMFGHLEGVRYPHGMCELLAIAVEPTKWDLGIGGRLMTEVERRATALNVEKMILHTAVENLRGQSLFAKHGFIPLEVKKRFYPEGQDALMMCKWYL